MGNYVYKVVSHDSEDEAEIYRSFIAWGKFRLKYQLGKKTSGLKGTAGIFVFLDLNSATKFFGLYPLILKCTYTGKPLGLIKCLEINELAKCSLQWSRSKIANFLNSNSICYSTPTTYAVASVTPIKMIKVRPLKGVK